MALADPLTLTINGVLHSLPRVRVRDMAADYQNAANTVFQTVSHQQHPVRKNESGPGVKSLVQVSQRKVVADPLNAESQEYKTLAIQVIIDRPVYGFSDVEVDHLWSALKAQLTTAQISKIVGNES